MNPEKIGTRLGTRYTWSIKRVPIMECHSILTYIKLSIALPPDDFSGSTKAG